MSTNGPISPSHSHSDNDRSSLNKEAGPGFLETGSEDEHESRIEKKARRKTDLVVIPLVGMFCMSLS
jgi:hypothetical protein